MLKVINPVVAKEVGVMSAMVFQHICYWMQTQGVDVIYRTNEELSSDLEESVSKHQIQRAKQKLIDAELIKVSFDNKCKFVRTTYYRLTKKGKEMLLGVKAGVKKLTTLVTPVIAPKKVSVEPIQEVLTSPDAPLADNNKQAVIAPSNTPKKPSWIPKHKYQEQKKQQHKEDLLNKEMVVSKDMKESFGEGMLGNKEAVKGIPEHLLNNPRIARMFKHKTV